jgi:hypothetical protein
MKPTNPQILFLHSAGAQHEEEGSAKLLQYLKHSLSADYDIVAPLLPDPEDPHYENWKDAIDTKFNQLDSGMVIIAHSLGGSVLLKYLAEASISKQIAAIFLVAVPYWSVDEDWDVSEFILSPGFADDLPHVPVITIFHSKDDQVVPVKHAAIYASEIPVATMKIVNGHGHVFWDGLPDVVAAVKEVHTIST